MRGQHPKRFAPVLALLASALLACGPATHTVGEAQATSTRDPGPRVPLAGANGSAGVGHQGAGRGGEPSIGSGSAGTTPPPTTDAGTAGEESPLPSAFPGTIFECGSSPLLAVRKRVELYMMVDSNINIPLGVDQWATLLSGINSYVTDERAAGTGLAFDYFSLDLTNPFNLNPSTACSPSKYASPAVTMGLLPTNAASVQDALRDVETFNASDMLPALEGALMYSKSLANWYVETKQAVVLVTDGFIDLACGSDQSALEDAAAAGAERTPRVPTYVIAVDVPDLTDFIPRYDPLDAIARGGGTESARHINLDNASVDFVEAMLEIQRDATPCEYAVPDSSTPDRLSLGLETEPGALPAALQRVESLEECGDGYYLLGTDAKWLALCPSLCTEVRQNDSQLIWFSDC